MNKAYEIAPPPEKPLITRGLEEYKIKIKVLH